jgi:hypothetical protein
MNDITEKLNKLRLYCEKNDYKGYDVSDGIASPVLTKTILNRSVLARFIFKQITGHRMAYINVRPLLFVPKFHNAKGISLFLNGYCNLYDLLDAGIDIGITKQYCIEKIEYLADLLINLNLKNNNYSGSCWGYPTAWQGRFSFYFPPNTPTVVATSFAVEALFHAYNILDDDVYKQTALTSSDFVLNDLKRTSVKNGFILSYAPLSGNNLVFNASLLGSKILAYCYSYSKNEEHLSFARKIVQTVVDCQESDGSWVYGLDKSQSWIDNFHTGYNLEALQTYQDISKDFCFQNNILKGFEFMVNNHFDNNNFMPKYFHNKQYPVDIHCCGEIFVVLYKLRKFVDYEELADGVIDWTFNNMWNNEKGYFYFQKHKVITNKVPLMRWSQAFMFSALTFFLKSQYNI